MKLSRRGKHTKRAGKKLRYKSKKFRASKRYHRGNKRTYKRGRRFHKGGEPEEEIKSADDFRTKIQPYLTQKEEKNTIKVTSCELIIKVKNAKINPMFETLKSDYRKNAIVTLKCQKGTGLFSSPRNQQFSVSISYSKDIMNNNTLKVFVLFTREDNRNISFRFSGTPQDVAEMLEASKLGGVPNDNDNTGETYSFNFPENQAMFQAISETILKFAKYANDNLTNHSKETMEANMNAARANMNTSLRLRGLPPLADNADTADAQTRVVTSGFTSVVSDNDPDLPPRVAYTGNTQPI